MWICNSPRIGRSLFERRKDYTFVSNPLSKETSRQMTDSSIKFGKLTIFKILDIHLQENLEHEIRQNKHCQAQL